MINSRELWKIKNIHSRASRLTNREELIRNGGGPNQDISKSKILTPKGPSDRGQTLLISLRSASVEDLIPRKSGSLTNARIRNWKNLMNFNGSANLYL